MCVQGQHVQLQQCLCVLMNSAVRFHIIIQPRSLALNSCLVPPPHHPPLLRKGLAFPPLWEAGAAAGPGLGGRVGKTLQTRHEQMPETLDCRADHRGRASR